MNLLQARPLVALLFVALVGCSGSSDDRSGGSSSGSGSGVDRADDGPAADGDTAPVTVVRTDIVEFDGSVEDVLIGLPEASRFASSVADWLAEVPGQEGVLRNRRGVTLFVPVDDGFSSDDRDAAFADPDTAAVTISEHLHVGVVDELIGTITMASDAEYEFADGSTIDGHRVLRTQAATNGVIHLIDGPLATG